MSELHSSNPVSVPYELVRRLYNVLSFYANETSYEAPRTGGVVMGCPRGETPTPQQLVWSARWILLDLEREVLKRDAWDWIGKYEPVGPHCPSCKCTADETTAPRCVHCGQDEAFHASFINTHAFTP